MAGGSSGGADIEGRAFDAGPTAQNESAASIGEAAGLSGQAAKDYGIAQMDALDAQHGTNFGQRARGLTGNNSIGTAELDSFGFDADAPAGLQHAHQRTAFQQALDDPSTMMAQLKPVPGKQYNAIDFIEQFGPLTATTHNQTPWRGLSTEDAAYARAMSSMPSPTPPGLGLAILGTALGLRNLTGDTPQRASTNYGMGVGGGPDAANMSLDDFGINNALSQEESDVYNFDNAYAQLDLDPFYNWINPAIEAIKNSALAETAKQIDAVPIPGLEVIQGLDIGKKALDAIPGIMGVDFPSYGPDIPGRAQDDVFEPSMDLQMQEIDSIFDGAMVDPFDMSMAMVSTEDNPWGYNQSVIDGLNASFDTGAVSEAGGEALQEAIAQRTAETIIAQQAARQVTPQSNKVTIPTSSGPDIVIDVTPPAPQKVAPHRRTAPKPSPIKVAATSVAKPKVFKKLPKFAQKEIRQGKIPTGGSDYVQDMVRDFLGGQKAVGDSGTRK